MKKISILLVCAAISGLFAADGKAVFDAKCSVCHTIKPPAGMMKGPGTPEFKKAMAKLKAPPMVKIAQMAKMHYPDKEAFVDFVVDYITDPDASKTVCMKKAIQGFGLMPSIGKGLSDAEKKAVAEWMYGLQASKKMRMMKCGEGKCGASKSKPAMKCGAGKCGGSMIQKTKETMQKAQPAMKCGMGKCGGGK